MQKISNNSDTNKGFKIEWFCRTAPSLGGGFAGTPQEAWGTPPYEAWTGIATANVVFFGLYGLPDFYALWRHKGRKAILWAGSDITHFVNGYHLDEGGSIKIPHIGLGQWINTYCESYVENWVEQKMLKRVGIEAKIAPSFLGNIDDYEVSFEPNKKLYTTVSGDEFVLYGWDKIPKLAEQYPDFEFHLYGNKHWPGFQWQHLNVIVHGRVSQEQMNEETKKMQGAIRLTQFDGFSEILAKSILWGQHPVSPFIKYPHMDEKPQEHTEPNLEGRDYYRNILNDYPWNSKKDTRNT